VNETIPTDRPVILLTRPRARSEAFAHRLGAAFGDRAEVLVAPLIEIVATDAELPLEGITHLLVTSANALPALDGVELPGPVSVLCVGPRTAEAARRRGLTVACVAPTAAELADAARNVLPNGARVLYLRGAHVATDIAAALRAAGHHVDEVVVYDQRALPLSDAAARVLGSGRPVIAPLFSARSARLLRDALAAVPIRGEMRPVAISPAVARAFGAPAAAVAEVPTAEGVLQAIRDVL